MKKWIIGLLYAFLNGAANGVTTMIVAPDQFNFDHGLKKLGAVVLVSAIVGAATYVKQYPPEPPK